MVDDANDDDDDEAADIEAEKDVGTGSFVGEANKSRDIWTDKTTRVMLGFCCTSDASWRTWEGCGGRSGGARQTGETAGARKLRRTTQASTGDQGAMGSKIERI